MTAKEKADLRRWAKEWRAKTRKAWRHVQRREPTELDSNRAYPMFGGDPKFGATIWLEEGGWCGRRWMTTPELEKAQARWIKQSYQASGPAFEERLKEEGGWIQCGGCRFFGAFDGDFGLCCNPESPMDGHVTFEHGGCDQHSNRAAFEENHSGTNVPK
jgi:hypothetical protein